MSLAEVLERGRVVDACLDALESSTDWAAGAPRKQRFKVRYNHTSGASRDNSLACCVINVFIHAAKERAQAITFIYV